MCSSDLMQLKTKDGSTPLSIYPALARLIEAPSEGVIRFERVEAVG